MQRHSVTFVLAVVNLTHNTWPGLYLGNRKRCRKLILVRDIGLEV